MRALISYTSLTRARFEELCQDLFRSTLEPVEKVPRDCKISSWSVVLLVFPVSSSWCPTTSMARNYGTIQAAILSGDSEKTQDSLFLDVATLSLGIGVTTALTTCNTTIRPRNTRRTPTINPASSSKGTKLNALAPKATTCLVNFSPEFLPHLAPCL